MRRLAIVALAIVALVAACGGGPSSPAIPVRISLLEYQPKRAQTVERLLPAFEATMASRGTPVRVDLESLDLTDEQFKALISERYAQHDPPDVTSYPSGWVPDFAAAGDLADLTARVAAWPDWAAHFYAVLRERALGQDGRIDGIPRGATVIQLFYRRDILEQYGISTALPRTWADLLTRMIELRDRMDAPPILIPAGTSWGDGTFDEGFINLLLGTDSPLYDDASHRWIVRSPGLTDVFRFYATLAADHLLPVGPLLQPEPWQATKYKTFPDGQLAVTTQGTWGWTYDWGPNGRAPIGDLYHDVATWEFPSERSDGQPFVWAAEPWDWTISSATAHADAAWQLVRWLSTGEAAATDLAAVGNLAPRDDLSSLSPYRDQPELIQEEQLIRVGRSFLPRVGIDHIRDAVGVATQGILTGELTGDEAASTFARLATEALGAASVMDLPAATP